MAAFMDYSYLAYNPYFYLFAQQAAKFLFKYTIDV